jgi:hypothetical protein
MNLALIMITALMIFAHHSVHVIVVRLIYWFIIYSCILWMLFRSPLPFYRLLLLLLTDFRDLSFNHPRLNISIF